MLDKVISGGQTGADISGLETARKYGIPTGGTLPFGYKTSDGPRPEYKKLYGVTAHSSSSYVPRTKLNVKNSDGTIRLAFDFDSPGEICTKKAIDSYKKPWFDVNLNNIEKTQSGLVASAAVWIEDNEIKVLNVAGNREPDSGTSVKLLADKFLSELFELLGHKLTLK